MSTSTMFRFSKKLKALKPELRRLSMKKLDDFTLTAPNSDAMGIEARVFTKWQRLAELEEKYLRQKSKLCCLNVDDKNNLYFHQAAKIREVRNSIREVVKPDGSIVSSQEEIKAEVVQFFLRIS